MTERDAYCRQFAERMVGPIDSPEAQALLEKMEGARRRGCDTAAARAVRIVRSDITKHGDMHCEMISKLAAAIQETTE